MIRLEQHEGLSVNLLDLEVLDVIGAAWQVLHEVAHLLHRPLERVALQEVGQGGGGGGD